MRSLKEAGAPAGPLKAFPDMQLHYYRQIGSIKVALYVRAGTRFRPLKHAPGLLSCSRTSMKGDVDELQFAAWGGGSLFNVDYQTDSL
jgi:hypothetical protein